MQLPRFVDRLDTSHRRVLSGAIVVAIVVLAALWWQWPAISGADDELNVGIVADDFLARVEQPVSRRIREDGRTVSWFDSATTWCDAPAAVRDAVDAGAETVVVSFAIDDGCADTAVTDLVDAADGHRLVVVTQPGGSGIEGAFADAGVAVVDPARFVGDRPEATSLGCQWWDICPVEGVIAVRAADGGLTLDGGERVARMVVAELR